MKTHSRESRKRGEVAKHQETLSLVGLWGVLESQRATKPGGKNKLIKPTDYAPNCNSQQKRSPDARICHQQVGAEQGGVGCIVKGRTRPECPEGNLRDLT